MKGGSDLGRRVVSISDRDVADRLEIIELIHRYARAIDERQWDLMEQIFAIDVDVYLNEQYEFKGRDQIICLIRNLIEQCTFTQHLMGNHVLTMVGDVADAQFVCRAFHRGAAERATETCEVFATYHARLSRTSEGWRATRWEERCPDGIADMNAFFKFPPMRG